MRGGAKFPPVVLTRLRGSDALDLQDGWHRCAAAAGLEREAISAVVFNVDTDAEGDLVSRLAFELSEIGVPWQTAVQFIRDALATGATVAA